ncbi:Holliday junction branch migration protein RuvA [Achromobacter sp. GG226]|uniref:Holliday junction branch migration protein RuvA n=1 Tax=Verticiella alkaliphila TaxID=2779529 RepID=UPI001C0D417B|nr:Holliday junction branch migration protein RuvA [Verticiella sp. GG226]MBU4612414.1 Holliday junction branch migration protein RuvA [Verticiella sp. GG226]
MIGRLTGTLLEKLPPTICLDVQGVGYDIEVPMSTLYALPDNGARVSLLTHLVVREDAHVLYGFATPEERMAFRQLIKISGVGARIALAVLSGMTVAELSQAITLQEAGRLTRIPGIGKKTAERLLLELKGKLGADLGAGAAHVTVDAQSDILHALTALGYSEKETTTALKSIPTGTSVTDGIKMALKLLAR